MVNDVVVIAEHAGGALTDTTFELLGKARQLADDWGGQAIAVLVGDAALATQLGAAGLVVTVDGPGFVEYTSDSYLDAVMAAIGDRAPRLVMLSTTTAGLDLAGAMSVRWDAPLVSSVVAVVAEGDAVVATSQIYGGKIMAECVITADRALVAVIAGSFPSGAGHRDGAPDVEALVPSAQGAARVVFRSRAEPAAGDVDITAVDVLVAVGRGIGSKDDIELVQEFAEAIGAPVAASRPVVDAGWLPKTRQVGKSGLKVKPRAYIMFGISGAPEHLEGMRDAELIIACNTDAKAPIFDVAHYGTTVDLFDLLPELTEKAGG
ncbi:MAG: electron transfer flavoprotein alpha subunit [Acidimicrobiaceae bacterium]|nr:MAG: electron transfer flavoprotein alpha subunit [Acidimicrobiaceae bacterium]